MEQKKSKIKSVLMEKKQTGAPVSPERWSDEVTVVVTHDVAFSKSRINSTILSL